MTRVLRHICYGLLIGSSFLILTTSAQQGARNGEWRFYGGELGSTRYSPLDQINRDNIKDLEGRLDVNRTVFSRIPRSEARPRRSWSTAFCTSPWISAVCDRRDAGTGETLWIYRPK